MAQSGEASRKGGRREGKRAAATSSDASPGSDVGAPAADPTHEEPSGEGPEPPRDAREQLARIEKLELERDQLAFQKSFWGRVLEFARALAVPVAVAAIPFFIALFNTQSTRLAALDRLGAAITQLGVEAPEQRRAAVVLLGTYLSDRDQARQSAAMQALLLTLVTETDSSVALAILSVLEDPATSGVTQQTLNEGLARAIAMSRLLFRAALESNGPRLQAVEATLAQDRRTWPISGQIDRSWIGQITAGETVGLTFSGRVVIALLRRSNVIPEGKLTNIYCDGCDFSGMALNGVEFSGSVLDRSDFSFAQLHSANFDGASISGTSFYGADLRDATLRTLPENTRPEPGDDPVRFRALLSTDLRSYTPETYGYRFPIFECANLQGADFAGRALVRGHVEVQDGYVEIVTAPMAGATLDRTTNFEPLGVLWEGYTWLDQAGFNDPEGTVRPTAARPFFAPGIFSQNTTPLFLTDELPATTALYRFGAVYLFAVWDAFTATDFVDPASPGFGDAYPLLREAIAWSTLAQGDLPALFAEPWQRGELDVDEDGDATVGDWYFERVSPSCSRSSSSSRSEITIGLP